MAKVIRYQVVIFLFTALSCALISFRLDAQFTLRFHPVDSVSKQALVSLQLQEQFTAKVVADKYLQQLVSNLQAKGFLAASIDSISASKNQTEVWLYTGLQYKWASLVVPFSYQQYLQASGIKPQYFNQQPFSFEAYDKARNKLLDYFENNGYPFASVGLDSITINAGQVNAKLKLETGIKYKFDSIRVFGNTKISKSFLQQYLSIPKGSWYKRESLLQINRNLSELPFLQQTQPWDITMLSTGSIINLYLEPKKSNQLNLLAGFLPANQQLGGKLLFTIDANMQLKNAFGNGESLGLVWQQIQPKSPRLNLQFQRPYIFNSSLGLELAFDLFRRDSSFLTIQSKLGIVYQTSARQKTTITLQQYATNITNPDTLTVKFTQRLPDIIDVSTIALNTTFESNTTDYRFNPRKGTELKIGITAGSRTIKKNSAFTALKSNSFDYSKLYDSLQLKSYQLKLMLTASHYFTLGKLNVLKTGLQAGWVESPNLFRNELFQIGGYKMLRGFDEESIFTNRYAITTLEYRLLLPGNSYFFGFTDFGFSQFAVQNVKANNQYIGIGLGLNFETRGGIFNLAYAAGKRNDLPLDMRQSKIHFGYVTVF